MQKAAELDSTNGEFWFMLGDLLSRNEKSDEALQAYQKVTELDPENPEIWLDYSDLLLNLERKDEALEIISQGIAKLPHDPDLQYRMGVYLILSGRPKEALQVFEKALTMNFMRHHEAFVYKPELKNNVDLMQLIETYRTLSRTKPQPGDQN
jgi:tetratricopeptide (TPR) repeat protein